MKIVLFGPPGAGKGTVAGVLVKRTGALHISTGDLLRANMRENTPLGEKARGFVEAGQLVPDELIIAMMEQELSQDKASKGFILDGFPRTIPQAELLDRLLTEQNQNLDGVFDLQVPQDVIMRRLSGRRICPNCEAIYNIYTLPSKIEGKCDRYGNDLIQRADDQPEAIAVRFDAYNKQTTPLLDYYQPREVLYPVDASAGAEHAADAIQATLGQK